MTRCGKRRLEEEFDVAQVVSVEDRLEWDFPFAVRLDFDAPPPEDFKETMETGVKNGNCLPACFAAVLECLHHGEILSKKLGRPARAIRSQVTSWTKEHWLNFPVFNPQMTVHEMVSLAHDIGIAESEREEFGHWGEGPQSRYEKYSQQCEKLYFCEPEMVAFSCMMHERGLGICFRTWRAAREDQDANFVSHVPDPAIMKSLGYEKVVLVDLLHSGELDGLSAHYRLLDASSVKNLCTPTADVDLIF